MHGTWVDDNGSKYQPYLEFNWWHDFEDEAASFNGVNFGSGEPDDRFDAGLGLVTEFDRNWSLWANAEYQFGAHGMRGVEGMLSINYSW